MTITKMQLTDRRLTDRRLGDRLTVTTTDDGRLCFDVQGKRGGPKAFVELSQAQTEYLLGALAGLHERRTGS